MAVITISRQYGSEGDEIAANICQILGYQAFDKQLMAKVAAEVGLTEGEIVDFTEDQHKVRGFLDRLLGGQRQIVTQTRGWGEDRYGVHTQDVDALNWIDEASLGEDRYGKHTLDVKEIDVTESITLVQTVIRAAYGQGNFVIVGRGGQAVLRNEPGVLHVRIEAPLETRVHRVQLRKGLTYELARDVVAQRDRAAADYLKRFYGVDWSDSLLYHLILNTGRWGIEAASRLIVDAVSQLQPAAALN